MPLTTNQKSGGSTPSGRTNRIACTIYSKSITIKYKEEDFTLVNQAFESIKKQFIK